MLVIGLMIMALLCVRVWVFFPCFCDGAEVVIIYKSAKPNLAMNMVMNVKKLTPPSHFWLYAARTQ